MVYIREAHALDGQSPRGGGRDPLVEEPLTVYERLTVANTCRSALDLAPMPMLIDDLDNATADAYIASPERLYLVDIKGKLAYVGPRGFSNFDPDALEVAIKAELEKARKKKR